MSRTRAWIVLACVMIAGALAAAVILFGRVDTLFALNQSEAARWIKRMTYWPLVAMIGRTFTSPLFYLLMAGILILERIFPADPKQKLLSTGFVTDAIWFFLETILNAVVIVTYVQFLREVYFDHFAYLTVDSIGRLPGPVRFLWGMLLADFLSWFHHLVRHKVQWFWHFHTVHHSQRQMNVFTDLRYHVVEYVIAKSISTIPLLMLSVDMPQILWYAIFRLWFTRFYHAGIRTNLGPLQYVFVTPQSHRIHHSIEPQHRDLNYGVILSIWDRIFGTQYEGYDEYPDTGIDDPEFPLEHDGQTVGLLWMPIAQHIYPFRLIGRSIRDMFVK